jgi:hypothetical protein
VDLSEVLTIKHSSTLNVCIGIHTISVSSLSWRQDAPAGYTLRAQ